MTYKKFYFGKLNAQILKKIDAEHKTKMKQLIKEINQGSWTEKQKKRQKRSTSDFERCTCCHFR